MTNKIGFIGLGIMGKPMAKNLIKKGYSLVVFDILAEAVRELVEAGAEEGKSCKDVAEKCDIIITMLPNSPHVRQAIFGENGIVEGAGSGKIILDMSSIDPTVSRELHEKLGERGIVLLDAPVSGGEPKAKDATLSIMVGGPEDTFEKVKDILLCMGSSAVLVGDTGSGNVAKLANQIIVVLNIAAMSEALVLSAKAGVDPEKVYKAIRGGLAGSTVLDAKAPMVLAGDFKPGFKIELHIKDLMNAMAAAHTCEVPLPLTGQVLEMMFALKADGKEKNDHSGLVQYYEKLAGIEVKA